MGATPDPFDPDLFDPDPFDPGRLPKVRAVLAATRQPRIRISWPRVRDSTLPLGSRIAP